MSTYGDPIPGTSSVSVPVEVSLQSKTIYCFGAKKWTKIIAIVQIIYAVAISVIRIIRWIVNSTENKNQPARAVDLNALFTYWYIDAPLLYQILEGLAGTFLGLILLVGAHLSSPRPRPRLLILWLIIRGIEIIFYLFVLISFIIGILMGGGLSALLLVFLLVSLIAVQIFSFFAVYVHCKELHECHNQMISGFPFSSIHNAE